MGAKTSNSGPSLLETGYAALHRFLHAMGIPLVHPERLSIMSAPIVRLTINQPKDAPVLLAYYPTPWHRDEPIAWVRRSHTPCEHTLFYLHFDTSDDSEPDRARLALAAPLSSSHVPHWLAVNANTGRLHFAHSRAAATLFSLTRVTQRHTLQVALHAPCATGTYLTFDPLTHRARILQNDVRAPQSAITLEYVALPPPPSLNAPPQSQSSWPLLSAGPPLRDATLAAAIRDGRATGVRIQSVARSFFLSCKPGGVLSAARDKDAGWDAFTLEYDCFTNSVLVRDARGHYLGLSPAFDAVLPHDGDHGAVVVRPERFYLKRVQPENVVAFRCRKGYLSARRGGRIALCTDTVVSPGELFLIHVALPSMTDQRMPRLRLRACANGVREIEGSVMVPVCASLAFQVLTDYTGFATFIQDATESEIVSRRSKTELTVRMVQCHSFLMLTVPMSMTLDVVEEPARGVVTMKLNKGLGVRQYDGVWSAVPLGDERALLTCRLEAATTVPAPGFLLDGLMSHATEATLAQVREECIRRAAVQEREAAVRKKSARGGGRKSVAVDGLKT